MLARLVEKALAARFAVLGLALALAAWGGWSFMKDGEFATDCSAGKISPASV